MIKTIALTALVTFAYVHNVHSMQLTNPRVTPEEKIFALAQAMFEKPSQTFELTQEFIALHKDEIATKDATTGNTLLHENVIEACWGGKPARLVCIAALLACGADRTQRNLEGLTPLECAQEAGNQAVIDLLSVEKPDKQTLLSLVTRHKLEDLKPMLLEQ